MEKYIAIIFDIVGSRHMFTDERVQAQKAIERGTDAINDYLCGKYYVSDQGDFADFQIAAGDSVIGLVKNVTDAATAINLMITHVGYDARLRIAIGYGEWTLRMENYGASAQDGPVFWSARAAMDSLKADQNKHFIAIADEYHDGCDILFPDKDMTFDRIADEFDWEDAANFKYCEVSLAVIKEMFDCHTK